MPQWYKNVLLSKKVQRHTRTPFPKAEKSRSKLPVSPYPKPQQPIYAPPPHPSIARIPQPRSPYVMRSSLPPSLLPSYVNMTVLAATI